MMTSKIQLTGRCARILRNTALVVFSGLVFMEIVLRIWSAFPGSSASFVPNADSGFRMRPGTAYNGRPTNSSGFNDREHDRAKDPGVTRLAFIGDSFVAGAVARDELFTSIVEKLAKESGLPLEVLNMGIPAAGPENYLGVLRNDASNMDVDIVCIVFFVGNDVLQSHPDFVTRIWFGAPRPVLRSPFLLKLSPEYFTTFTLLRGSLWHLQHRLSDPGDGTFSPETFLRIEYRRLNVCKKDVDPFLEAAYERSVRLFESMKIAADRSGMDLFVVLAPDQFQVDSALRSEIAEAYRLRFGEYDILLPQRRLNSALEELYIPVVNLLPEFQKHGDEVSLYLLRDTHWNREGNRKAAESIFSFLRAKGAKPL